MRQYWMVWDGECGMCSASASWVRGKDRNKLFQIVTLQNCPVTEMRETILKDGNTAMYVFGPEGKVWRGADGVLTILRLLGWGLFAQFLLLPPMIWILRLGYDLVARNRAWISKRFFGGIACGTGNRYPEVDELPLVPEKN